MHKIISGILLSTCVSVAFGNEYLSIEFHGIWGANRPNPNPSNPLTELVGTTFSGRISIPTAIADLDSDPEVGFYSIPAESAVFEFDSIGTNFDINSSTSLYDDRVLVRIFNDASESKFERVPYHRIAKSMN